MTGADINLQAKNDALAGHDLDQPLVTFALFAYNQERYVREAIEGAFAQTYEPLEIILSDDCSSDGTFEIMQEMAAAYRGPHAVIVNRTPGNKGVMSHFLNVARQAKGVLFVVAAGDDISYPLRTETLFTTWSKTRSACMYSAYDEIDIDSNSMNQNVCFENKPMQIWQYFLDSRPRSFCYGMSAAYSSEFLSFIPNTSLIIFHEDVLITLLCYIFGNYVIFEDNSLIRYRVHQSISGSKFNRSTVSGMIGALFVVGRDAMSHYNIILYIEYTIAQGGDRLHQNILNIKYLAKLKRVLYLEWKSLSGTRVERLRLIREIASYSDAKIIVPRIFGIRVYACIKSWQHKSKLWMKMFVDYRKSPLRPV